MPSTVVTVRVEPSRSSCDEAEAEAGVCSVLVCVHIAARVGGLVWRRVTETEWGLLVKTEEEEKDEGEGGR